MDSSTFEAHTPSTAPTMPSNPPPKIDHASDPSTSPQLSTVAPRDRSRGRNVHIYDARDRTTLLGGLVLTSGVTNSNFYSMVEVFVFIESSIETQDEILDSLQIRFEIRDSEDIKIERNNDSLRPGEYYIVSNASLQVTNESALIRTISHSTGFRIKAFTDTVRQRDRRCVISGAKVLGAHVDEWTGFKAAHIFPIAYESYWTTQNYARCITISPERGGTINSVQNGLLLRSDIHQLFDSYHFSINPDDNYKVIPFSFGASDLAGKHLDQELLENPQRPVDELLRWHFRQAVLVNMKGAGEPLFEHDFPPGSDIVGDILQGPKAAERMEYELFSRLASQTEVQSI